MSLLNKPIAEITYQDVEIFCLQKPTEGPRLDYKREFNAEHRKLICAFANTLGGAIILGVEGDANNQPIWPPHGLTNPAGLEDRIIQIAQEAIYPPIRPRVSRLLADPTSGKSVVVVRVDESPEAPHAVEKGTEVYVYERTGSINKRWSLAHIDRIAYLLNRRRQYDQERESFIRQAITRGQRYLNAPAPAVRWASIIPLYPWRRLCDPEVCYSIHHGLQRHSLQRFPDGSFAMHGVGGPEAIESISARGHLFIMEYPSESRDNPIAKRHDVKANDFLVWNRTVALANKLMFQLAKPFFENPSVELPGLMQFDFGFLNAFGKQMLGEAEQVGRPFPDSEFRAQVLFPVEDLIRGNMANEQQLFQEIMFGFDLFDTPPRPVK